MRIAVCVKQVPDSGAVSLDPETHTLVRGSAGAVINPLDEFPLEVALRMKDKINAEVTVFTMGPARAEEVLARALAMGADNAFLLCDRNFAGSDTWATSFVLAKTLGKYGPFDLILFGKQAVDGDTAQVGPETAAHMGLPQAASVSSIEMPSVEDPETLKVTRMYENGYDEVLINLPAVMMVLKEAAEPRFGTLQGRLNYFKNGVEKISAEDIGTLPEETGLKGSPTRVIKTETPQMERELLKIEGSSSEQAAELAKILKEKIPS